MNTMIRISTLALIFILSLVQTRAQDVRNIYEFASLNGFDLANLTTPVDELHPGGPPRDGVPSVDRPRFAMSVKADFIADDDYVLGVTVDGESKAYPIRILSWHEVVNDQLGTRDIAVTYSPLCAAGIAYASQAGGIPRTFGVSGLLHNSNTILYDRETESLWSQATGESIAGFGLGEKLEMLPATYTTWKEWKALHPQTLVMTTHTGHERNYARNPYKWYESSNELLFPVSRANEMLPLKEKVVGIEVAGNFRAYPFSMMPGGNSELSDFFNGQEVRIAFNPETNSARVTDHYGREIPSATMYWFAWYAFHPDTDVHGMDHYAPMLSFVRSE